MRERSLLLASTQWTWDQLEDAMSASWSIIKHQATSCDKLSRVNLFLDSSGKRQAASGKRQAPSCDNYVR